jgi:NAD(P) transhydrogenase subunit beta
LYLTLIVGSVTFTGSIIAYAKLAGKLFGRKFPGQPFLLPFRHPINAILTLVPLALAVAGVWFWGGEFGAVTTICAVTGLALVLGIMVVIPIGGGDMPVVISLLNSYSGIAAAMAGFALGEYVLVVTGSLVGASGMILTKIMCKAMNRSLANVMFGGFGAVDSGGASGGNSEYVGVKSCDPEEAAMVFENAQSCIVVPGYGMAVAQAQHAVRELTELLEKRGCLVRFAIHPVAGRMPGHMNVLLAEANVPYDKLVEMDQINSEFKNTDVSLVIGANDVVNPAAKDDPKSPIYGMPVLNVEESRTVFVIKRSLGAGFAGIKNTLFEHERCQMIYADAKKGIEAITKALKEG